MWILFRDVCLPIFILIGLGWLLDRRFKVDLDTLVKLNLYLFVPAFIFVHVVNSELPGSEAVQFVGFTLLVIASMFLLSSLVAIATRAAPSTRKSLQLSTMFYNSGNYGIPLMTLAFPEKGPPIQVFILMTMNITTFSIGLSLASSQNNTSPSAAWKNLLPVLRQPSIYAIAAALLARHFHLQPQNLPVLWEPLNYLAAALVGFALITLGVQLSKTKPPRLRGPFPWAVGIRLLGGPLVALALTQVFPFDPLTNHILILGASVPTAVNTALIAHEFKADSAFAAAAVFYSTVFSLATVTIILTLLKVA
ncbi:MAG: AEC family transporter [Verrucomicrobiota bacterium]